jgi:ABC transporter with metal-binding/Fe-S-binding domain ATP-binding protein
VKVAALYSGGKDSNFALYLAQQNGLEVDRLITLLPQEESWMYHVPNIRWTSLQSRALGIPQVMEASQEGEEAELRALKQVLRKAHPDGLVVGAVASDYQYTRVNSVCEELGLWVYAPLWRKDPERLLREYVEAGFRVIIVGASAEGMDESWLGRVIDEDACEALLDLSERYGLHPVGEGGEFETLVLDGPNFRSRLEILEAEKEWKGNSGTLVISEAALVDKN